MTDKEVFALFDYGCAKNKDRKFTLAGQSSYFDLYAFTNEDIDLIKELDILNALLIDHDFKKEGFVEFLVWIDHRGHEAPFVFSCQKDNKKMSAFDVTVEFFR